MGYRTWKTTIGGHDIHIKLAKDRAESLAHQLKDLLRLSQHARELTGILGQTEGLHKEGVHEWFSVFTPHGIPIRNPETYPQDVHTFLAGLPVPITEADLPTIRAQRTALWELHIPIKDSRETPEARAEKQAESLRIQAEISAKVDAARAAIVAEWGSGETIEVPADSTAIVLQQTYDASDAMTDYFHRHATHGPAFLLGYVPGKARQTEALARAMVSRYPGLARVEFTWHTENYSMGHGNYLMSKDCPGSLRDPDDANSLPCAFEVQFAYTYSTPKTYHTWQTYPGQASAPLPADAPTFAGQGNGHGTPRLNAEKGGVEIKFASRPDDATLAPLKAAGWRWSKFSKCWYTKDSPRARQFASEFTGVPLA